MRDGLAWYGMGYEGDMVWGGTREPLLGASDVCVGVGGWLRIVRVGWGFVDGGRAIA